MLKKTTAIMLLSAALAAVSCSTDISDIEDRLDNLENGLENAEGRLTELETALSRINSEMQALQYLKDGIVINTAVGSQADGWTVTLSNGTVIRVWPKDESSLIPVLSISEDGYWMSDLGQGSGPQYIHDAGGNRVPASTQGGEAGADGKDGVTPRLGVDSDGYWTVSYDEGVTYVPLLDDGGNRVKAQVSAGDSIFKSVDKDGDYVVFALHNGATYRVPLVPEFLCAIKDASEEQEFEPGQTRVYVMEMKGVADAIVLCPQDWSAVLDGTSLSVTAPAAVTKAAVTYRTGGYVSVLATCTSGFATIAKMAVKTTAPVEPPKTYDTYMEMWAAGEKITLGGVVFDPADYPSINTYHITGDQNVAISPSDGSNGAIYFIDDDVTVNYATNKYTQAGVDKPTIMFVANKIDGGHATLEFNATLGIKGEGSVIFKGMTINVYKNQLLTTSNTPSALNEYLIFDGCKIRLDKGDWSAVGTVRFVDAAGGANAGFNHMILVDTDVVYPSTGFGRNVYLMYLAPTNAIEQEELVIKNVLCYTSDGGVIPSTSSYTVTLIYGNNNASYGSIDMENSTFINCFGRMSMVAVNVNGQLVRVGGDLTVKNNLYYYNGTTGGYVKLVGLGDGFKTGVNISASENYCWAAGYYAGSAIVQSWGNVRCTALDTSPFASMDFTNGTFTLTSEMSALGVGAKR